MEYAGRSDLYEGLNIWGEDVFLIVELYNHFDFLPESGILKEDEKEYYRKVPSDIFLDTGKARTYWVWV